MAKRLEAPVHGFAPAVAIPSGQDGQRALYDLKKRIIQLDDGREIHLTMNEQKIMKVLIAHLGAYVPTRILAYELESVNPKNLVRATIDGLRDAFDPLLPIQSKCRWGYRIPLNHNHEY